MMPWLSIPHPRWRTRGIPHPEALDLLQQGLDEILPLVEWHPITVLIVASHVFNNAIVKSDLDLVVVVSQAEYERFYDHLPKEFRDAVWDLSARLQVNLDITPQVDCRDYMLCYDLWERTECGRDAMPAFYRDNPLTKTVFDFAQQRYVFTLRKPSRSCFYRDDLLAADVAEWRTKYGPTFIDLFPLTNQAGQWLADRYGDD